MKVNPKISVILPCYHVERFLPDVFSDLKAQTFTDFEMIFVNDGGGENILRMLKSYAVEDDRVVVIDKPNGGVSSARNVGMDRAKGEWIVFVDPDDRLKPYYLQSLLESVDGTNSMVGVAGFKIYYVHQDKVNDCVLGRNEKDADLAEWFLSLGSLEKTAPWNKIFKRSFLCENNIRYDETKAIAEDANFCMDVFLLLTTIGIAKDCGYVYRIEGTSATYRYHSSMKKNISEADSKERELLLRLGVSENEIIRIEIKDSAIHSYMYVINVFKAGDKLSLKEKIQIVRKEILQDEHLMGLLHKYDLSKAGLNLKLCTLLLYTGNAWLVGIVFNILFILKRNFSKLFYWYDKHLSGKLK